MQMPFYVVGRSLPPSAAHMLLVLYMYCTTVRVYVLYCTTIHVHVHVDTCTYYTCTCILHYGTRIYVYVLHVYCTTVHVDTCTYYTALRYMYTCVRTTCILHYSTCIQYMCTYVLLHVHVHLSTRLFPLQMMSLRRALLICTYVCTLFCK